MYNQSIVANCFPCGCRYNLTLFKSIHQDETILPIEKPTPFVELVTWNVFYFMIQCTPVSRLDYTDHPLDLAVSILFHFLV